MWVEDSYQELNNCCWVHRQQLSSINIWRLKSSFPELMLMFCWGTLTVFRCWFCQPLALRDVAILHFQLCWTNVQVCAASECVKVCRRNYENVFFNYYYYYYYLIVTSRAGWPSVAFTLKHMLLLDPIRPHTVIVTVTTADNNRNGRNKQQFNNHRWLIPLSSPLRSPQTDRWRNMLEWRENHKHVHSGVRCGCESCREWLRWQVKGHRRHSGPSVDD